MEKTIGGKVFRTVTIKLVDMDEWLRFKEVAYKQMRKQGTTMSLWEYFGDILKIHNRKGGNIG